MRYDLSDTISVKEKGIMIVRLTLEAAFDVKEEVRLPDISEAVVSALEELRGEGAARIIAASIESKSLQGFINEQSGITDFEFGW